MLDVLRDTVPSFSANAQSIADGATIARPPNNRNLAVLRGGHVRLYNYYKATGGNGTIALDGVGALRREEPLHRALTQSVGSPPPLSYYTLSAGGTTTFTW